MGYYVNLNLIKERINMSKETMRETINTIKSVDSMKAVKVAFDISQVNMDSITKVTEVVSTMDKNMKLLATKVLKLEKKIEELDDTLARRINNERSTN